MTLAERNKIRRKMLEDATQPRTIQRRSGVVKDGKAVVATETPVMVYDEVRRQWVAQVLLMSGLQLRNGRNKLPIVDSHNDKTVRNVFGSVVNLQVEGDQLVGIPEFASDDESQKIRTRYDEGHLNDFSIDAVILSRQYVPEGHSYTKPNGEVIDGPAEIVTAWEPHNASICATGADPNSTVRRSYDREEVQRMDEALMQAVSKLGVPEGMTDPVAIITFLAGKASADADEAESPEVPVVENMAEDKPVEEPAAPVEEAKVENMDDKVEAEVARRLQADTLRRQTITNDVKLAKLERSFADSLIEEGVSIETARERIIRKMAQQPLGSGAVEGSDIRVTASEQDKFVEVASAGLIQRCYHGGGIKRTEAPKVQGAEEFKHLGIYRLAELCVRRMGLNPERFTRSDVARLAMGSETAASRLRVQRSEAYHTTGSFANILLDAASKTLRAAYEEAPYTWSLWARQAASVDDFKNINRVQIGESPNLEIVPETKEYPEGVVTDSKVSYKIDKYGKEFSVSWETVVNDDLDALSRIPAMHGNAARRTQEKLVYDALLANPTMPDGFALFSASHPSGRNINSATAAAPSETTLDEAFRFMGLQKGLTGDALLGLTPSVLLVPLALSATASRIVNSQSFAQANGNEGIVSLYGINGDRPLRVVATPYLDANSTTQWYAIANSNQVDTVEITFLAGEESPVLESEWVKSNDVYKYYVRQSMAAAVIDHRGIYGNR